MPRSTSANLIPAKKLVATLVTSPALAFVIAASPVTEPTTELVALYPAAKDLIVAFDGIEFDMIGS